ncbi:MAG TPA: hypothetical protein VGI03_04815 [Verrucomicrobiae bacterium]|jgi:hypothetical protein
MQNQKNVGLSVINSVSPYHGQNSPQRRQDASSGYFPQIPLRLPARLNQEQAAMVLGFPAHSIPVLVKHRLLKPLGNVAQNSVKFFPTLEIETCCNDIQWLHRATAAVGDNWKTRNGRRIADGTPEGQNTAQQPAIDV